IWTARVEEAVFGTPSDTPRAALQAALVALIDSFDEMRPQIIACVEAIAPAIRSETLRTKLAESYAEARAAGTEMVARACAELGIAPPEGADTVASLIMAIADGLMIQWLVDPERAPDARQAMQALTLLAPFLAEEPV